MAALHPALQLYRVTVRRLDGTVLVTACNIQGDEWLMSAAVQKWQPWMNIRVSAQRVYEAADRWRDLLRVISDPAVNPIAQDAVARRL